jgi:hypothetical protein
VFEDEELKRRSQVGQLRGEEPVNTTMGSSRGDFLRMTERFSPNATGLDSLFADQGFRNRFPQARIHKNDWIDLGDGTELIDAIEGFDRPTNAGTRWQWLTESEALKGKANERRMVPMGMHPAADNSALARILVELNATSEGRQSPAEREAVLAMLQGL